MQIPDPVQGVIVVVFALLVGFFIYDEVGNNEDDGFLNFVTINVSDLGPAGTPEVTEEPEEPGAEIIATDEPSDGSTPEPDTVATEEPADDAPVATAEPAATEDPCATPEPGETVESTEEPAATDEPEATIEPAATEDPCITPEPTDSPQETVEPDGTPEPDAADTSESTEEPAATDEPEATEEVSFDLSAIPTVVMARFASSTQEITGQDDAGEEVSATPFGVDVNILVQWLMFLGLLTGVTFAVRKDFTSHRNTMTFLVLINWFSILGRMEPSLEFYLENEQPTYSTEVIMLHVFIGVCVQLYATYLILRMWFENVLPEFVKVKNIKLWMRITVIAWMTNILIGTFMYFDIYG